MIRVLVADDHAIVREGLRQVLALAPDLTFAGEARNGWQVLDMLDASLPDLLLLDMSMPGPSGVEIIRRIRAGAPRLPILVLSMHQESQIAARAIKAGASGYVTKDSEPEVLLEAMRRVAGGAHFVSPDIATRLVFESLPGIVAQPHDTLSNREYQIFLMLARGRGINDIAAELHLSAKTVSTHKARLMPKLGLANISELVRYAVARELI